VWSFLGSIVSGLVAAGVVYLFGIRQLVVQRRLAFVERQLTEFYAPLAGLRKQIRAKSQVRERVSSVAGEAWQEFSQTVYTGLRRSEQAEDSARFTRIIEYDNAQFKEELLPKYREMLSLFTDRYHLAAEDTRAYYETFLEFVEIWNRSIADALPREVVMRLGHNENSLAAFYEHLEAKMQALQAEIARGGDSSLKELVGRFRSHTGG
jgi:hypothetical protein